MSKTPSLTSLAIASKKEDLAAALVTVTALRKEIADMRASQRLARAKVKADRVATVAAKKLVKQMNASDRAAKKAARIAKLEAKLAAMKSAPVGRLAIKAAKKPSKVTVTRMAA
jgi:hypothetical protein